MPRKIFDFENQEDSKIVSSLKDSEAYPNSISACGCLFYKVHQGSIHLLLIEYGNPKKPKLDDLGGKIEGYDETLLDALAREVSEETNSILSKDMLLTILNTHNVSTYYNRGSKYLVKLIEVEDTFFPDTSVFGDMEHGNNYVRTIQWYEYETNKTRLAERLQCVEWV